MDHKLLPCPCCGSTDLNADKVSDTLVYCMGCGLRAINTERWNTRANRPADDGLAARLDGMARVMDKTKQPNAALYMRQAATALRAQSDAEVEREAPTLANCTGADS